MHQMTPDQKIRLKKLLILHEGLKYKPYKDIFGNITIGIGRNLSGKNLNPSEVDLMYQNDVDFFYNQLCQFDWFNKLDENRQIALIDMSFMGWERFVKFKDMIHYLSIGNYKNAAKEILDSLYPKQVGQRANDLAHIIETGSILGLEPRTA